MESFCFSTVPSFDYLGANGTTFTFTFGNKRKNGMICHHGKKVPNG
jgi:hypothetical protein